MSNLTVNIDHELFAADIVARSKKSIMETEEIRKMTIRLIQGGYLPNTSEEKLKHILDGLEDGELMDVMVASDEILTEMLVRHYDSCVEDLR